MRLTRRHFALRSVMRNVCVCASSSKPRIINVVSHCGLHPLPGFAVYSASKAAIIAWTKALRMEHMKHVLSVVAFVPGGFDSSSNIIARQTAHGRTMLKHLNDEQRSFYENRMTSLTNYLEGAASLGANYDSLKDKNIIATFVKALIEELYKVESLRYMFYYNLFTVPTFQENIYARLVKKFLNFPE